MNLKTAIQYLICLWVKTTSEHALERKTLVLILLIPVIEDFYEFYLINITISNAIYIYTSHMW